jgi:FdhD protein
VTVEDRASADAGRAGAPTLAGRRPGGTTRTRIRAVDGARARDRLDSVATEEPLQIRLTAGGRTVTVAITMRTPGADFELAAGFLSGEAILAGPGDLRAVRYCVDDVQLYNTVTVDLAAGELPDLGTLDRHFFTSSACGVCGAASLEALATRGLRSVPSAVSVSADALRSLPGAMRQAQGVFEATGGLHAAGLFDAGGSLLAVREDVGRHNAVDKLVGRALLDGELPLSDRLLMVSGRASFEICQKAVAAGIPLVAAVSAPSSLAVATCERFGVTLVGFLRGQRFNVYTHADRIVT